MGKLLRDSVFAAIIFFSAASAFADNATFLWDFGAGASSQTSTLQNPTGVVFSSTGTKQVTLTVTRFGCTATITKNIEVVDVHCGNNKVLVCHKGKTLCINTNALQPHINHGDCLGECSSVNGRINGDKNYLSADEIEINVSPNPFNASLKVVVKSQKEDVIKLELYNAFGQKISAFSNHINATEENVFEMNGNNLSFGIYILKIHSITEDRYIKLIRAP